MIQRRSLLKTAASMPLMAALGYSPLSRAAQTGTSPELAKIMTGFPPGGTLDVLARRVADKLRGGYATNMLVENKAGAAGQVAIIALKDSNPDGSVMLLTPSSMLSIYPFTYSKLQYSLSDVRPVALGAYISHGLAVGPMVPETVKTLKDFMAWAKANPSNASFGSPGAGSMPHMIGVLMSKFAKVDLQHIPYRGSVPGVQDLLGGQIAAFCGPIGDYLPHIAGKKLRVLAISSKISDPLLPSAPTFSSLGYPIAVREWYGFFLPGKTSEETARRASAYLQPALAQPDLIEAGKKYGLNITSSSADELADLLKADAEQWKGLIKQVGFSADS